MHPTIVTSASVIWWYFLLLSFGDSVCFGNFGQIDYLLCFSFRSPTDLQEVILQNCVQKEENMMLRGPIIFLFSSLNLVYLLLCANVYGKVIAFSLMFFMNFQVTLSVFMIASHFDGVILVRWNLIIIV